MKRGIFEEQTTKALKKWQKSARDKRKLRKAGGGGSIDVPSVSGETTPSQGTSPMHLLHKFKPSSHTDTDSVLYSPRSYQSDQTDFSDTEGSTHRLNLDQIMSQPQHNPPGNQLTHNIDFSFDKP